MRVLLVVEPVARTMGSERVVEATRKWLEREGVEVGVVDPRLGVPEWVFEGVDVVHFFNSGSSCVASWKLLRRLRDIPLVVTVTYWPPAAGELRMAKEEMGIDVEQAGFLVQARAVKDTMLFRIAELADGLIFTSEREEREFYKTAEVFNFEFRAKRFYVENAVDPEEVLGIPIEKEAGLISTVGRVEVAKNQWMVIKALRNLVKEFPELRYVCVGKDHLGLGKRVTERFVEFRGEVEPREALEVLGRSEVHVLVSFRDTPGLASLEAAALGCKLVVSDDPFGTARDYFPEDLVSFVDPLSEVDVYRGIKEQFLSEPNPALQELVLERYTYPVVVKKLIGAYDRVR